MAPQPYSVPELEDSADGWGPSAEPEKLQGIPFAPFSKSDKLGKAADWTNQNYQKYSGTWGASGEVEAARSLCFCCFACLLLVPLPSCSSLQTQQLSTTGRYSQNPVATVFTFFQNEEVRFGGGWAAAAERSAARCSGTSLW